MQLEFQIIPKPNAQVINTYIGVIISHNRMCTGACLGLTLGQYLLDDTRLASIPVQACTPGSLPLLDMSIKHRLRVRFQYHVIHMVHLSYLNEMQHCICMNVMSGDT